MFGINPIKIMVIVAVVLLLLGPDKLPEVAHKLGSTWRAMKRLQERVETEVRDALPDLPSSGDIARMARSPINLLNQLADQVDAKESSNVDVPATSPVDDAPPAPGVLLHAPRPRAQGLGPPSSRRGPIVSRRPASTIAGPNRTPSTGTT